MTGILRMRGAGLFGAALAVILAGFAGGGPEERRPWPRADQVKPVNRGAGKYRSHFGEKTCASDPDRPACPLEWSSRRSVSVTCD